jgi:small subunit ribosomal protein S13
MGISRVKDLEAEKEKEERKKAKEEVKKVKEVKVKKAKEIVRIADTDLDATKPIVQSLRSIKGISFAMAKAICVACGFDPRKRLNELNEEELKKLENAIKDPASFGIPAWMLNRRKDPESGKDLHLTGTQVDIRKKFDIQREIDLKSWKGIRHMLGLPVRGQRTRAHFRTGKTVGVMRKAAKLLMQKAEAEKKEKK